MKTTPKANKPAIRKANEGEMFWGESPMMCDIRRTVENIVPTDATVLNTGENGTGKDVLAREIHSLSSRRHNPMVCVDAGAIRNPPNSG